MNSSFIDQFVGAPMHDNLLSTSVLGLAGFLLVLVLSNVYSGRKVYVDAPLVGRPGILGGFDFTKNGWKLLQEGYDKHKHNSKAFKIANRDRYGVYVTARPLVEELRKAPEDTLSFLAAVNERIQAEYTLGKTIIRNPYHVSIVRSQLTRSLGVMFPEIDDELKAAFGDCIDAKLVGNEWISVPAYPTVMNVVARISNRMFVGAPLCRDPGFIRLSIKITLDVISSGNMLKRFPRFLRPLAARWSAVPENLRESRQYVGPIIAERKKKLAEFGPDWAEKPNDMLSWLLDEAKGEELTDQSLITRIMMLNFAAVHTSSMSFTHVLYHLAANPEYAGPMREEIERMSSEEGWSKASFGNMHKVDSFVRESLRVNGVGSVSMHRLALKPYTFENGLHIPKGAWVSVPATALHTDDDTYEDAATFKPFRFAPEPENAVDKEGQKEKTRLYAVSTSPEFVTFGHGQHACPGRFFAVNELKMMLAHVLVNYDVKFANEGVRPANIHTNDSTLPDTRAQVMFRHRQT